MQAFDVILIVWTSCWTNNQIAGDLSFHDTHVSSLNISVISVHYAHYDPVEFLQDTILTIDSP